MCCDEHAPTPPGWPRTAENVTILPLETWQEWVGWAAVGDDESMHQCWSWICYVNSRKQASGWRTLFQSILVLTAVKIDFFSRLPSLWNQRWLTTACARLEKNDK